MILTSEDLKRELATHKCKLALKEIDVPGYVIDRFKSGRLLDYFVHLCIMQEPPMPWPKALKWIEKNRKTILDLEQNGQRSTPTSPANGTPDHGDAEV